MTRRAILLIGTEKTGTTSLQAFLARNRAALGARGVIYPRFPGQQNHTALAAYAMDDARRDPIRGAFGVHGPEAVPTFRRRIAAAAAAELRGSGWTTAVFCNEHCHGRLRTEAEIARLEGLLAPHFDRIDICVYLRRQDELALSLYSTRLKSGGTGTDIMPRIAPDDPYFNYDVALGMWEAVFGRAHVHVRLFDRKSLVGGDIVSDVLTAWGLGARSDYAPAENLNEGIAAEAQDYLRRINHHLTPLPGLGTDAVLGPLAATLARVMPGRGARPARAEAEAFYGRYRESNAAVARRHLPGRATLFSEAFSSYPETPDPVAFDADAVAAIAARLHLEAARETRRLEAEIAIRDGQLAWERGDRRAALAALRRGVEWLPDHAESHRALAEYLHRDGQHAEALRHARRAAELRPARADYHHFLGVVLRAAGDAAAAAEAQREALALDPDHTAAAATLAALEAEMRAAS